MRLLDQRDKLLGKNHNIVRHPDMNPAIYTELCETIGGGGVWRGDVLNRKKDGSSYWVSAIIGPVLDRRGNKIGYNR